MYFGCYECAGVYRNSANSDTIGHVPHKRVNTEYTRISEWANICVLYVYARDSDGNDYGRNEMQK